MLGNPIKNDELNYFYIVLPYSLLLSRCHSVLSHALPWHNKRILPEQEKELNPSTNYVPEEEERTNLICSDIAPHKHQQMPKLQSDSSAFPKYFLMSLAKHYTSTRMSFFMSQSYYMGKEEKRHRKKKCKYERNSTRRTQSFGKASSLSINCLLQLPE